MTKFPAAATCAFLVVSFGQPVFAACTLRSLDMLQKDPGVTAVFRAKATDVESGPAGQLATFQVTRVWKGQVRKAATVYNFLEPATDSTPTPFELGKDYLVSTRVINSEERTRFGLPAAAGMAAFADACSASPSDGPDAEQILHGAAGTAPQ
jgi:hypothetical protein